METTGYVAVDLTQWFTRHTNPTQVGVYRVAHNSLKHQTFGYAYWNGTAWEKYGNWSVYHTSMDFVWQGLTGPTESLMWQVPL
jgi:hypothetical protein